MSGFRRLAFAVWLPLFGFIGTHGDLSAQPRSRPAGDDPAAATASHGENFSSKPAAALFASDCTGAGCHKGPQGLGKEMSSGGLSDFLREHYTNSRESAAALTAYLRGVPGDARGGKPQLQPEKPERAERPAPRSRAVRTEEPAKPAEEGATPPAARPSRRPPRDVPSSSEIMREEGAKEGAKEIAKPEPRKPEPRKPLPKPAPRARQVTATPPTPPAAAPEPPPPAAPPPPPAPKQYDIFD